MLAPSDRLHLALQRILRGWDYVSQDIQQDRSDLFHLFIALLTVALAAIGSVLVDKVPMEPGGASPRSPWPARSTWCTGDGNSGSGSGGPRKSRWRASKG